ncbi:hypothetical protein P7K49_024712 [Saguinus oedipus]|uniref:Uncharacterized protein n=1 Tax=Saguinus oedipus TaxID=9490 RepID=A0ABQ9UR05_SAGOE|nr:hypothetical protein P7K49_024712 [Saguinus oedipus]
MCAEFAPRGAGERVRQPRCAPALPATRSSGPGIPSQRGPRAAALWEPHLSRKASRPKPAPSRMVPARPRAPGATLRGCSMPAARNGGQEGERESERHGDSGRRSRSPGTGPVAGRGGGRGSRDPEGSGLSGTGRPRGGKQVSPTPSDLPARVSRGVRAPSHGRYLLGPLLGPGLHRVALGDLPQPPGGLRAQAAAAQRAQRQRLALEGVLHAAEHAAELGPGQRPRGHGRIGWVSGSGLRAGSAGSERQVHWADLAAAPSPLPRSCRPRRPARNWRCPRSRC